MVSPHHHSQALEAGEFRQHKAHWRLINLLGAISNQSTDRRWRTETPRKANCDEPSPSCMLHMMGCMAPVGCARVQTLAKEPFFHLRDIPPRYLPHVRCRVQWGCCSFCCLCRSCHEKPVHHGTVARVHMSSSNRRVVRFERPCRRSDNAKCGDASGPTLVANCQAVSRGHHLCRIVLAPRGMPEDRG